MKKETISICRDPAYTNKLVNAYQIKLYHTFSINMPYAIPTGKYPTIIGILHYSE